MDALVCNAGVAYQGLLSDMTDEDWRRVMGVDLDGVFYCCRRAIPSMVRRQKGSILTISSMWGLTGGSCEAAYSAAKAGVIGLTKALAKELGPSGVRVNCIAPGVIHTQMNGNLTQEDRQILADETPLCRLGTPEEVAGAALFLSQEDASFITGQVLAWMAASPYHEALSKRLSPKGRAAYRKSGPGHFCEFCKGLRARPWRTLAP